MHRPNMQEATLKRGFLGVSSGGAFAEIFDLYAEPFPLVA